MSPRCAFVLCIQYCWVLDFQAFAQLKKKFSQPLQGPRVNFRSGLPG